MTELKDRLQAALGDAYRFEKELGGGGMSRVFVAHEVKLGRTVVVKVLPPEMSAGVNVDRFHREIQLAAKLQHPHIVPLLTAGAEGDLLFYIMPHIEGQSLRARLARDHELPVHDAVRILREVADALAYAHGHRIVHRDIKPDNILLSGRHAVVTDFGVAKAVAESTGKSSLTSMGVALGTPAYMAPEQAAADPNTDHRADIYALGAVAYEMLTGRPPFTGPSPQAVLAAQVTLAPEPVTQHRESVPPALAAMVMRCLKKHPADRYQTAEEMVTELEQILTPSGGVTPLGTAPYTATGPHRSRRLAVPIAAAVGGVVLLAAGWMVLGRGVSGAGAAERRSIAVLPFATSANDTASAFFADGIHDDILTQLGRIRALKVISRTSVMEYRNVAKNLRQIGQELGVQAVMEGQVQRAGARVRINVQLIDARNDEHLWAETYERELTLDTRFAVQAEIAAAVAQALQVALSPEERAELAARPTSNPAAYDSYLRGKGHGAASNNRTDVGSAVRMFQRAGQLDPRFALAFARLGMYHALTYHMHYDRTPERLRLARAAIDSAFGLVPDLPEAHMALGHLYYWGYLDYERALAELKVAERGLASDPTLYVGIGSVQRPQGRMEEALVSFRRGYELDPRSFNQLTAMIETLLLLRRYDESNLLADSARTLYPDLADAYAILTLGRLVCCGDVTAARRVLEEAAAVGVRDAGLDALRIVVELLGRNPRAALDAIAAAPPEALFDQFHLRPRSMLRAEVRRMMGDLPAARAEYEAAARELEEGIRRQPSDERLYGALGIAYANLGRREEALKAARRGVELLPYEREAWRGAYRVRDLARTFAALGEPDSAVAHLRFLLARPTEVSVALLTLEPEWDRIRSTPAFRRLVGQ